MHSSVNFEIFETLISLGFYFRTFKILLSREKDGCGNNFLEEKKFAKLSLCLEEAILEIRAG